jgi:predicted deacylase
VLGSNFQYEYEEHQASEKQRKRDIFTAIRIGLVEFKRKIGDEVEANYVTFSLIVAFLVHADGIMHVLLFVPGDVHA